MESAHIRLKYVIEVEAEQQKEAKQDTASEGKHDHTRQHSSSDSNYYEYDSRVEILRHQQELSGRSLGSSSYLSSSLPRYLSTSQPRNPVTSHSVVTEEHRDTIVQGEDSYSTPINGSFEIESQDRQILDRARQHDGDDKPRPELQYKYVFSNSPQPSIHPLSSSEKHAHHQPSQSGDDIDFSPIPTKKEATAVSHLLADTATNNKRATFNSTTASEKLDILSCPLCFHIPNQARKLPCCKYMICLSCAKSWVGTNANCPFCRSVVTRRMLLPAPEEQAQIDLLLVFCPYEEHGCPWVGCRVDLIHHLQEECIIAIDPETGERARGAFHISDLGLGSESSFGESEDTNEENQEHEDDTSPLLSNGVSGDASQRSRMIDRLRRLFVRRWGRYLSPIRDRSASPSSRDMASLLPTSLADTDTTEAREGGCFSCSSWTLEEWKRVFWSLTAFLCVLIFVAILLHLFLRSIMGVKFKMAWEIDG